MSSNSTSIYTGVWINWSHGLVLGSTITLPARNGAILTSFIAIFITIVGAQLWQILSFFFHQIRVSQAPKDGLYHQHQNVFRNASAPGAAAWWFLLQGWHWSGRAQHALLRSLPWLFFSTFYILLFAVLSIFGTSTVTRAAGQDRVLQSSQCGYWQVNGSKSAEGEFRASTSGQAAYRSKLLKDSQAAATYDRNCNGASVDALQCKAYATSQVSWEGKVADCPFSDEICLGNNTYQMDTGLLDSHHHLGINMPEKDRLKYRRVTTCSVLRSEGYATSNNETQMFTWYYGPTSADYTFGYSKYALSANFGYAVT
jgi:hypothetical protein